MAAKEYRNSKQRIRELEQRLADAEEALRALKNAEVDAIIVSERGGEHVYTLEGADEPYRMMVQVMAEGAVTLARDGLILFSNEQFASMVELPLDRVIGSQFQNFVVPEYVGAVSALLGAQSRDRAEIRLIRGNGTVPARISLSGLAFGGVECACAIVTDLSDQERNRELVASEGLARSILEQAAEAMVVADPQGRIIRSNSAADELAGMNGLHQPFDAVFALRRGSTSYRFRDILSAVSQGKSIKGLEVTSKAAGGRASELLLCAASLRNSGSGLLGCVIGLTDITARKAIEGALRDSESEARRRLVEIEAIYESAPVGLTLLNTNMRFARVNRRFAEMNGWPAADHIGRTPGELNPDFGEPGLKAFRQVLESGEALLDVEVRGTTATQPGVQRVWNENWVPVRNETGEVFGICIAAEEVTAKRAAEEALRASEAAERARAAELKAIMDAAPAATFIARDPECLEIVGNRMGYDLLRLPTGSNTSLSHPDVQGHGKFRAIKDGHPVPAHDLPLQRAASTGTPVWNDELEIQFDDGASCSILGSAVPLRDDDGKLRGAVGVFLDITDRKRTERRLQEKQKLESIGFLAGGIAHDFNNLLVGILGNASLAIDMLPEDSPVAVQLNDVIQASEQAARLTSQMLAYAGKGRFVVKPLDLSNLVRRTVRLVQSTVPKHVAVNLELKPDLPLVDGDMAQLEQVVLNLVLNASEAMPETGGSITIRTGVRSVSERYIRHSLEEGEIEPGQYVWLEVSDTGCGMDESTQARIFDPFFTTKFTGRGLGLAAVKGIMRGHNGAIRVTSAPARGSSFLVLLPVAVVPAAPAQPDAFPAKPDAAPTSGTVLVIDDEEVIRKTAKAVLERQGYTILLAGNGRAALELFNKECHRVSAVLLDLTMSDMNGQEVLPKIRHVRPDIPVIVSSGYNRAQTLEMFEGQELSGFLQKPYSSQDLIAKVKAAVDKAAGRKSRR